MENTGVTELAAAVAAVRLAQPGLGIKPMAKLLRERNTAWQNIGMKEIREAVASLDAAAPSAPGPQTAASKGPAASAGPALTLSPLPSCSECHEPLLFDANSGHDVPSLESQSHIINECCGALLCHSCAEVLTARFEAGLPLDKCPYCQQQHPALTRTSTSVKRFQKLASAGNAEGLFALGVRYRDGEDVPKDGKRAVELLSKAIDLGHTDAAIRLADMLLGVARGQERPREGKDWNPSR